MINSLFLFIKRILYDLFNCDSYYNDEMVYDHNDEINYIGSDLNEYKRFK